LLSLTLVPALAFGRAAAGALPPAEAAPLALSLFQQRQLFSFLFPSPCVFFSLKEKSVNLNFLLARPH